MNSKNSNAQEASQEAYLLALSRPFRVELLHCPVRLYFATNYRAKLLQEIWQQRQKVNQLINLGEQASIPEYTTELLIECRVKLEDYYDAVMGLVLSESGFTRTEVDFYLAELSRSQLEKG